MNNQNFINIDGAWYETTETKDATGLISNGRFIEEQFSWGDFHSSNATSSTWKQLGAIPARPLEIPSGDYPMDEFTAEEWSRLVPGCVVEWTGPPRTVVLPTNDEGYCVVKAGPKGLASWSRTGVRPADHATAFIVGRRPVAKEPEPVEIPVTEVTSEVMYFDGSGITSVPAEWAGKTVEIRLVGAA